MGFKARVQPALRPGLYELVDDETGPVTEVNRFLRALQVRGLSPCTIRAYAYDLVVLYRWLGRADKALRRLTESDLLGFVEEQQVADAQPSSINRRLTTCRLLYRFCTNRELEVGSGVTAPAPHYRGSGKDRNLGLHVVRRRGRRRLSVKVPRTIVEPLTRDEVRAFLRSLRRYRDLALVHLMLLCGLRSGEVLQLRIADVSLDERQLRVRGKGGKERMLPLPDVGVHSLSDYLRFERPARCRTARLFVVRQGPGRSHPMTPADLRNLFRHRRLRPALHRANAHRFRHTFGTDMARAGVRLPILQRMMGHAHGTTTLRYIELSMADIADEYRRAVAEIQKRYPSA